MLVHSTCFDFVLRWEVVETASHFFLAVETAICRDNFLY